jgi:osmotically-inducible protein OsmY
MFRDAQSALTRSGICFAVDALRVGKLTSGLEFQIFALVFVSLSAATGFSGCRSWKVHEAMAQEVKAPVGAGSVSAANYELEQAVRAKLGSDKELRGASIVVIADVTRNQVTLSGSVASSALRQKAIELARSAQVGVSVNDRIEVSRTRNAPSS